MKADELVEYVEMVARTFAKRGLPADLMDEVRQRAAVSALGTEQATGLPLRGNRAYYFRGASTDVALGLHQARSVVHVTEHATRTGQVPKEFYNWETLIGCGYARIEATDGWHRDPAGPATAAAAVEEEDERRMREKLLGLLDEHVATLKEPQQQAIRMLLGIGTPGRDFDEVLQFLGCHRNTLNAWVRDLGRRARADRGAVRARRLYLEASTGA